MGLSLHWIAGKPKRSVVKCSVWHFLLPCFEVDLHFDHGMPIPIYNRIAAIIPLGTKVEFYSIGSIARHLIICKLLSYANFQYGSSVTRLHKLINITTTIKSHTCVKFMWGQPCQQHKGKLMSREGLTL